MTREELAALISCNPGTLWRWKSSLTTISRKHGRAKGTLRKELKKIGIRDIVIAVIPE
jgi:hypothetical protein